MESKCFSCKNKNVKASYGYTVCNYSGSECRNFELYDPIKQTNADRIRSMSDRELAEFMCNNISNKTVNCAFCAAEEFCHIGHIGWIDWLKQECE